MDFLIPIGFFVLIGWIVRTISDNKIRKRALLRNDVNESIKHLWEKSYANKPSQDMKWTIIFLGIGVVALTADWLYLSEATSFGLSCLVIGAAYLTHYFAEKD